MTDPVEQRLRAADPAGHGTDRASEQRIHDLMAASMSTAQTGAEAGAQTGRSRDRHGRWTAGLVAAGVAAGVAVGVAIGSAVVLGGGEEAGLPATTPPSVSLRLPPADAMSSCVRYSIDVLAQMPTAFSGEVVSVGSPTVVLDVDRWYRGGDSDQVQLTGAVSDPALVGNVRFVAGERYLVTADESGTVNACGYSAQWEESLARDFESAFSG